MSRLTRGSDAIMITGCDSGIGLELVKYFHATTDLKIVCCFKSHGDSPGYHTIKQLQDGGESSRLALLQTDLTSEKDMSDIKLSLEQMDQKMYDNLIAIINNAGILVYGDFDWLTWTQIHDQVAVNFLGTLRITQIALPYIIKSRGRIINVSSVNDSTVFPGISVYSATKSALSTFSKGLGYEMRKLGVKVITVRLGDYARLTNIIGCHAKNCDIMWSSMNERKRSMYDRYFHEFNEHLLANYGMTSPPSFKESRLFNDFKLAVLGKNPPSIITSAPLGFRLFYFIVEMLPVWCQFHLLDLLIRIGFRWRAPDIIVPTN